MPSAVSRRAFLRTAGAGGLALGAAALLAACGTPAQKGTPGAAAEDLSDKEKTVNFSNWPLYIDYSEDEKSRPSLEAFEEKTGITVNYTEEVNDNAEFFGKVQGQLSQGQPTGRDLFVLTDYMAARMINHGWLQKLDHANLPNVEANLLPNLASPSWDADRSYAVPWQSGLTGIAYNAAKTGEVRSFQELLTKPELKGRITFLSEMQDTMAFMLSLVGKDPSKFTDADFDLALERLQGAVDVGQIRAFTGNDYAQDLVQGNIVAAMAWSGDVVQLQFDNPDIKFVAPEEGLNLWSDNMLVPNGATHKKNAELLMDHYYDPAVAAQVAAWVNYICPVAGAQEEMTKIDPELAENPLIFPTDDFLANSYTFMGMTEEQDRAYTEKFQKVVGA
ncbi:extracellular solute-binding protein [Georgenia ruanii]|uniref:Extracellular solute-binding protein n=1 Tax=Georgenia ruanii TaxID=348442 RepID=A0A7J9UW89_9MICO|nr:extracellular solute-binding protein [Georgenia ruanii]